MAKGISVPSDSKGMRIWKGRVAEQIDDDLKGGNATMRLLVGGDIQLLVDFDHLHNAPIREWLKLQVHAKPTHWKDVQLPSEKQAQALYLAERERSSKIRPEGYALRGAAVAGKQPTEETN